MAEIGVTDLKIYAIIGINRIERIIPQKVIVNFHFDIDTSKSSTTDAIGDTLNYRTLTKSIIREVKKTKFNLLEKLADHILDLIAQDERIETAYVKVEKPGALRHTKSVYVQTSYQRPPGVARATRNPLDE